jgi:hypothetical protein
MCLGNEDNSQPNKPARDTVYQIGNMTARPDSSVNRSILKQNNEAAKDQGQNR